MIKLIAIEPGGEAELSLRFSGGSLGLCGPLNEAVTLRTSYLTA
jgi:hypothetical protein